MKKIDTKANIEQIVYLDEETQLPIKTETYKNNRMVEESIEEYKKIYDNSEKIFECNGIELDEIYSPEVKDEIGVG